MKTKTDILREGSEILKPFMGKHGFDFSVDGEGSSSGGNFSSGSWTKDNRKLAFHYRHSLGLVTYSVDDRVIEHEFFVWAICGEKKQAKFPGASEGELDGFRRLLDDLNQYCSVFLSGSDEELLNMIQKAEDLKEYWESLSPFKRMEIK